MASRSISRLNTKSAGLLLCDMQEKFRNTIQHFAPIVSVSNRMLRAARLLDIPVLATEQYPKGLGPTVSELGLQQHKVPVFTKTCFSMINEQVRDHLKREMPTVKTVMLCGIEAQACIFQTAMDLLERDYDVHLIVDAISARSQVDRFFALRQLEKLGAQLTTSECAMFALLRDATHPKFKDIQKIIADPAPDSGLLSFK